MGSIETALDRAIESLVYEYVAEPPDRVRFDQRIRGILAAIVRERSRQEAIGIMKRASGIDWRSCADPAMDGGDFARITVLGEEFGEASRAVLETTYAATWNLRVAFEADLRKELIEVAAVAVAFVEAIDARNERKEGTDASTNPA